VSLDSVSDSREDAATAAPIAREIPVVRGHWLLGCLRDYVGNEREFILRGHEQHGDTFGIRLLNLRLYMTRDAEIVNAINTRYWEDFYKPSLAKFIWKRFLGNGLVPNDGPSWKRQHKLIMPAFHKQRIDAYVPVMADFTQRMIDGWEPEQRRDFNEEMTTLTLAIVVKSLFDADLEAEAETIRHAMLGLNTLLVRRIHRMIPWPDWVPTPSNLKEMREIHKIERVLYRFIRQRREEGVDRGDLLSHMVAATDEQGQMSEKQLRDEMMTLVFAGHETTAHALTWMWYLLARNPDKAQKLREEVDRVLGAGPISADKLQSLEYTDKVIKEAMRLLPSVWIYGREPQRDIVLGGWRFPKNCSITISVFAMNLDPEHYEEPQKFLPERWTRDFERALPKGQYVPFAAGPRVCLGKQFAMNEMRTILAVLMRNVVPSVPEAYEPRLVCELSQHPDERGMPMQVHFRSR
jgi:cytochrome P450